MDFYVDIVRNTEKEDRISIFCELVDELNLKGKELKTFAEKCGFKLAEIRDFLDE